MSLILSVKKNNFKINGFAYGKCVQKKNLARNMPKESFHRYISIGDCGMNGNFFQTLWNIPTE
jgi:hypothetical protein